LAKQKVKTATTTTATATAKRRRITAKFAYKASQETMPLSLTEREKLRQLVKSALDGNGSGRIDIYAVKPSPGSLPLYEDEEEFVSRLKETLAELGGEIHTILERFPGTYIYGKVAATTKSVDTCEKPASKREEESRVSSGIRKKTSSKKSSKDNKNRLRYKDNTKREAKTTTAKKDKKKASSSKD